MNKKIFAAALVFLSVVLLTMLCGCGRKSETAESASPAPEETFVSTAEAGDLPGTDSGTADELSDERLLAAIRNYCFTMNPDLENIVNAGEYPVYWEVSSSDENEATVLYRSYTGVLVRYYIDRVTGETYVTEFVPGITDDEQRTDESFNVRDYITGN